MLASWLYPNLDTPTFLGIGLGLVIGAALVRAILRRSRRLLRWDRLEVERTRRAPEDVYWGLLRAPLSLKAQKLYTARTGLPAFTAKPILNDGWSEIQARGDGHLLHDLHLVR